MFRALLRRTFWPHQLDFHSRKGLLCGIEGSQVYVDKVTPLDLPTSQGKPITLIINFHKPRFQGPNSTRGWVFTELTPWFPLLRELQRRKADGYTHKQQLPVWSL